MTDKPYDTKINDCLCGKKAKYKFEGKYFCKECFKKEHQFKIGRA